MIGNKNCVKTLESNRYDEYLL